MLSAMWAARAPPRAEDEICLELMGHTGTVVRLDDEPLIEPAMALMSCGPAFMALVAESFADAGAAHGLDTDAAMRMVVETMGGTADWLAAHGYDGPDLRARVATPGGTTEQGLMRLEDEGLRELLRRGRGRGEDPQMTEFPAARRHARRRGGLRAHAGPHLSRADLHPDHHELDPADAIQPLPERGAGLRQRDRPVPEPVQGVHRRYGSGRERWISARSSAPSA